MNAPVLPFVFSLLHAESLSVLEQCIENFLIFSDEDDFLIVNSTNVECHQVSINSPRVVVVLGDPRQSHGDSLLMGHVENWKHVKRVCFNDENEFVFSTMASNSLLFKRYDKRKIIGSMRLPILNSLENMKGWQYDSIRKSGSFVKSFGENYAHNQIEGFTTAAYSWELISAEIAKLSFRDHVLQPQICLEEVLPLPVISKFGRVYTNICAMKWTESRQGDRFVNIRELFERSGKLPHVCQYKWFDRVRPNLEVKIVTQRRLYATFNRFFEYIAHATSEEILRLAKSLLGFVKFPQVKFDIGYFKYGCNITSALSRKIVRLNEGLKRSAFLYFETLPDCFNSDLLVTVSGDIVYIKSSSVKQHTIVNASSYLDLKFYAILYIPLPRGVTSVLLTDFKYIDDVSDIDYIDFSNEEMLLNFCVLEQAGRYSQILADSNSYESNWLKPFALYRIPDNLSGDSVCFGVPIVPNANFKFSIRLDGV